MHLARGRAGPAAAGRHRKEADYLNASLPEAYKAQGLTKVGLVPDGEDFMIHTPRSNTLITRACWSGKVHHSAFRVISWSTLAGLSVEHTHMYFGRPPEPTYARST